MDISCVYFFFMPVRDAVYVKIGRSSDALFRKRQMTQPPEIIQAVVSVSTQSANVQHFESEMHKRMRFYRRNGEWFCGGGDFICYLFENGIEPLVTAIDKAGLYLELSYYKADKIEKSKKGIAPSSLDDLSLFLEPNVWMVSSGLRETSRGSVGGNPKYNFVSFGRPGGTRQNGQTADFRSVKLP